MSFHMQCQMIGTCKTSLTDDAFEWLSTGMFAVMSRQFIRARKTPFTIGPLALIRFFTCHKREKNTWEENLDLENFINDKKNTNFDLKFINCYTVLREQLYLWHSLRVK